MGICLPTHFLLLLKVLLFNSSSSRHISDGGFKWELWTHCCRLQLSSRAFLMWFTVCSILLIAWVRAKSSTQRIGHESLLLTACDLYSLLGKSNGNTEQNKRKKCESEGCLEGNYKAVAIKITHCLHLFLTLLNHFTVSETDPQQMWSSIAFLLPKHHLVDYKW